MSEPKKRLRLLNEVLPAPTETPVSSPRERTLDHLRKVLALAAAGTALQAGCTKEGTPPIRPDDDKKAKAGEAAVDPQIDTGPPEKTVTTAEIPVPSTGYMVVDPLPPPAACPGLAATIRATAVWKSKGGSWVAELRMPKPTKAGTKYEKSAPTAYGGKVTSVTPSGDDLVLEIAPDAGATLTSVYVSASCATGTEQVYVNLDVAGAPKAGGTIKVTLGDGY